MDILMQLENIPENHGYYAKRFKVLADELDEIIADLLAICVGGFGMDPHEEIAVTAELKARQAIIEQILESKRKRLSKDFLEYLDYIGEFEGGE